MSQRVGVRQHKCPELQARALFASVPLFQSSKQHLVIIIISCPCENSWQSSNSLSTFGFHSAFDFFVCVFKRSWSDHCLYVHIKHITPHWQCQLHALKCLQIRLNVYSESDDCNPTMLPAEVAALLDSASENKAFSGFEESAVNVGFLHKFYSARICSLY